MKWKTLSCSYDLTKLPKNKHDPYISAYILVSSTKKWSENNVYLMYFDFTDRLFHFPNYGHWPDAPKLPPFTEINKWMPLPNKPRMKKS
jgi:hypothetical protein